MLKEACVETLEEALLAEARGADRIELCSRLDLDGLTPSPELIREVCSRLKIPVMVMVRPREGDFVYSEGEIAVMLGEIDRAKALGAAGVVFGVLTPEGKIDTRQCSLLAERAFPLPVTFHKAIDTLVDPAEGMRQLLACGGITRVLTSGGKTTAREGAAKIREMMEIAGDQIIMLVAGKVTRDNVEEISALTGATEFHGRRILGNLV
jgi:copper homeostasis protein